MACADRAASCCRHVDPAAASHPDLIEIVWRNRERMIVGVDNWRPGPRPVATRSLPKTNLAVIDCIRVVRMDSHVEVVPSLSAGPAVEEESGGVTVGCR